ncbi:MAG: hypothetical protein P0Y49_17945 [Candidatus Pedobacter colombiensis]|uniref:Uncharacterized protein n=1 Tax=Candidatus Pedobacter colombiensis TaxID=3121371 RepID=A0AAJ5W981_9SPHI|nr:hypothetical protein [Pedobacter sp.]WEK18672.1 MAG: hypothetical protein P0Y49_17945 [Pedobacter sp.]
MVHFHVDGIPSEFLRFIKEKSKLNFHFQEGDNLIYDISFDTEDDIDKLCKWLLAEGKNKIKVSPVPVGNSVKVGNVYLVNNPDFKIVSSVYLKLIPNYKAHYIENLRPDRFIKFKNLKELEAELSGVNSINAKLDQGYLVFTIDEQEVIVNITPDKILTVRITTVLNSLPHYSESFTVQLPKQFTNSLVIQFLKNYLSNTKFRFTEIKKHLDSFSVVMIQERDDLEEENNA